MIFPIACSRLILGLVASIAVTPTCVSASFDTTEVQDNLDEKSVADWIRRSAIKIESPQRNYGVLDTRFRQSRVVALGEATHGQHEVFELKRQITMHLIQHHGFRLVAYEASVSKLLEANAYINGTSADRKSAVGAFGMLIWQIEENGELLDDLRTWNQKSEKKDQVRLIGCDAQDSEAALSSLKPILGDRHAESYQRAVDIHSRSSTAMQQFISGNRAAWERIALEIDKLETELAAIKPADHSTDNRYALFVHEYISSLKMYSSKGTRDRVMAELLMKQLDSIAPEARCVVWAHNGHIKRSHLRYLGTEELAMGGHLGKSLGSKYYALGVAFGEGEFQANVQRADNKWGFRRYRLSPSPTGSLEAMLRTTGLEMFAIDLLSAPENQAIQSWLKTGHGQRWYGGYSVPDDCDEKSKHVSNLLQTIPSEDFDGLLYVSKTTAAKPLDLSLLTP